MFVIELAAALFFSFLFVLLSIPTVIRIAEERGWLDKPGKLKPHTHAVTKLGGFAIFGGVLFSILMFIDSKLINEFKYPISGFFILFLTGFLDDIRPLPPWQKFSAQILSALLIVIPGKIILTSFYGFLGVGELHYWFSIVITVFILVGIANAYNIMDGVDLLAGIYGCWVTLALALWLIISMQINSAFLAIAISGALAAFLFFNYPPARIFLGDSGTMPIGMAIALLLIKSVNIASVYNGPYAINFAPVLAFSLLAIPLFELGRLTFVRISKKHSPFHGDLNHLHHKLSKKGWTHLKISLVINACGIFIFLFILLLSKFFKSINPIMFIAVVLTAIIVFLLLKDSVKKTPEHHCPGATEKTYIET